MRATKREGRQWIGIRAAALLGVLMAVPGMAPADEVAATTATVEEAGSHRQGVLGALLASESPALRDLLSAEEGADLALERAVSNVARRQAPASARLRGTRGLVEGLAGESVVDAALEASATDARAARESSEREDRLRRIPTPKIATEPGPGLEDAVDRLKARLAWCFDRLLTRGAAEAGHAEVVLRYAADGRLNSLAVKGDRSAPRIESCVDQASGSYGVAAGALVEPTVLVVPVAFTESR